MAFKSDKDLQAAGIPTIAMVLKSLSKKAGIDQLRWSPTTDKKKDNQLISDTMKGISENLKPAEIVVLQVVPDEVAGQGCREATLKSAMGSLEDYKKVLNIFNENILNAKEASEVLLRTQVPKTMWGGKEMNSIIGAIKDEMDDLSGAFNQLDACIEHSDNCVRRLQASVNMKVPVEQKKLAVDKILENFSFLKTLMSKMASNLTPLYSIDKDFQSRVGYPAIWFFTPSTFMDFTYEYDNLINHVIKSASIESDIMEPLLVSKITGAA